MDEDDHDELLQCSDEDSMSESDDQCVPPDKPEETQLETNYVTHSNAEFIFVKTCLALSSAAIVILLPLFQESIDVKGNVYSMIYFTCTVSVLILLVALLLKKRFSSEHINLGKPPLKIKEMVLASGAYTLSGFIVIYAVDRKKVMCHLQDPIKGLVLVFSLIYYFFFCKKLMGLQRIFSTTTIIVGLFISVDYGLCNEFRCRGNDREHKSDDAGIWTWQAHSIWAGVYIIGLALFSAYFMLLDRYLVYSNAMSTYTSFSSQFLSTVSRLVSFQSVGNQPQTQPTRTHKKSHSSLHFSFWTQVFSWLFTVGLFWTDIIPHVGKSENMAQFFNHTTSGLICSVSMPQFGNANEHNCGNTSLYALAFLLAYLVFSVSSVRFLFLSQSAVYTVAVASVALPLTEIWWSLFRMTTIQKGLLMWYPTLSGELICALLGLPIVVIGLGLLCKSHFKDSYAFRASTSNACLGPARLA